jgi:hypothetical protein
MVSLQDASRRLQVPVDTLWKWITDGKLAAEIRPGRGLGMEYYLDPGEMKRARDLRDEQAESASLDSPDLDAPANVISLDFADLSGILTDTESKARNMTDRNEAIAAMENLRAEALGAIERQVGRETAISELAAAVENLMNSMLEAMDRAQDANHSRLASDLESMRLRLVRQIQDRERDDLRLRDELAASKHQLAAALESFDPERHNLIATGVTETYDLGRSNG